MEYLFIIKKNKVLLLGGVTCKESMCVGFFMRFWGVFVSLKAVMRRREGTPSSCKL